MDDTSLDAHPSRIPSPAPILSTFELDALTCRTSLIQTTVNKFLNDEFPWVQTRVGKAVLTEIIKSGHLWIFVEGDKDHCLRNDPTTDSDSMEEWELSPQDVDTVNQMLQPDEALPQRAAWTTSAMRIGMIIWLVITSSTIQDYREYESAWDKWDVQGRAITTWADTYSEIIHSKKRPSEVIPTDDDAVAAFKSAMDIAGHQHDYQTTPEVDAWVTMRAALFPELQGTDHQKLQSETGLNHMPPLHLVALWEYFGKCEDFKERIAFAVSQRPHLFLPDMVKPIEELLAKRSPEKARREFTLHYKLDKHDTVVPCHSTTGPSWDKMQDIIDSLGHFVPSCGDRSFPPIEPISWFDMVRVLSGQYQYQNKGKEASWRPRASLAAACNLSDYVLVKRFPPLNLDLLPEYVQHAVKRFCQVTEREGHSCDTYVFHSDSFQTWRQLDVKYQTRYAAAYALLYSTDSVPLIGDDKNNCGACSDIGVLYNCVDAISAGQITLASKNIAKVLGLIKELAVISDDCKFTFPEDRSDVEDDSNGISESSQRPDDQQQRGGNSEIRRDETHNPVTVTENTINHFNPTALTQPEAYNPVWQADFTAPQIYGNLTMGQGSLYTMAEAHASAQEHVGDLTNLRWAAPREDSEPLLFRDVIPDSSLGEVTGSHVAPGANWSTEQVQADPKTLTMWDRKYQRKRRKRNYTPSSSVCSVLKFKVFADKHGVPLGTTGMAEARLPWKKMMSILADQGLEIASWPEGVPKPRSDGKADKGISGFNAEHIAALYKAMKAGQIDFRLLAGGSPTNDASQVRQREDDMEEEVNIRPTKKRKLAETRKKPKDFVAMQSVMKF
ncbi:hypothetical protein C8R44DRAFT_848529 [Mycena epipterygia]|nr:hypothetical protein C8R44DRAFT_848529 [Mycena epipterygia]